MPLILEIPNKMQTIPIIPEKMKVKLVIIDAYDFAPNLKHPTYFVDTEKVKHMDYWKYSPESCKKLVETVF